MPMSSTRGSLIGAVHREHEAERSACQGQQQAFREQGQGQATTTCSQRCTHRKLPPPCFDVGEEKIRDVGRCHEQHDSDRAEQNPQRSPDVADDVFRERPDIWRQSDALPHFSCKGGRQRELLRDERDHAGDIVVGLLECHAWLEARHPPRAEAAAGHRLRTIEPERQKHLSLGVEKPERRGQHASDLVRLSVDRQRRADGLRRRTERALPVAMRQNHAIRRARHVVCLANQFADERTNSQQREQPVGNS
jgi:hypothetical protein